LRVPLDLGEYFPAIHAGHVQIQQDQVRPFRILLRRLTAEVSQELLAIGREAKVGTEADRFKRLLEQYTVAEVVFGDQDDGQATLVHCGWYFFRAVWNSRGRDGLLCGSERAKR
jgi:hypothetical protein